VWYKTHNFLQIPVLRNYSVWNKVFMTLSQYNVEKGRPGTTTEVLRRGDRGCGIGKHSHGLNKDKVQTYHG